MDSLSSDGTEKMSNSFDVSDSNEFAFFSANDMNDSEFSRCSASTEEDYLNTENWRKGTLIWARPIRYPHLPWWPAVIVERPKSGAAGRFRLREVLSVTNSSSSNESEKQSNSDLSSELQLMHIKLLRSVPIFKVCLLGGFKSGGSHFVDDRIVSVLQTRIRIYKGSDELCDFMRDSINRSRRKLKILSQFVVPKKLQTARKLACTIADKIQSVTNGTGQTSLEFLPWINTNELNYASDHFIERKLSRPKNLKFQFRKLTSDESESQSTEEESLEIIPKNKTKKQPSSNKNKHKYRDLEFAFQNLAIGKVTISNKDQRMRFCFKCNKLCDVFIFANKNKKDDVLQKQVESKMDSSLIIPCPGGCANFGHLACLGGSFDKPALCTLCAKGFRECFLCKKTENDPNLLSGNVQEGGITISKVSSIVRCSTSLCRRWYHLSCLRTTPPYCTLFKDARSGTFVCPAHYCMTCQADHPGAPLQPLKAGLKCINCPALYHFGDSCIPSGSIVLGKSWIICPRHLPYILANEPVLKKPYESLKTFALSMHKATNVSWCFICSSGGRIICCENCPSSFHEDCVKIDNIPDNFVCEDCQNGRLPHYGEVVWVRFPPTLKAYTAQRNLPDIVVNLLSKAPLCDLFRSPDLEHFTSGMRWWPGEILHPKHYEADLYDELEDLFANDKHSLDVVRVILKGLIRVRLFNLNQFNNDSPLQLWSTSPRIFPFEEGDDDRLEKSTESLEHTDKSRNKSKEHGHFTDDSSSSSGEEDDPVMLPSTLADLRLSQVPLVPFVANYASPGRKKTGRHPSGMTDTSGGNELTDESALQSIKRLKRIMTESEKHDQKSAYRSAVKMAAHGWNLRRKKFMEKSQEKSKGPVYYKKIKVNYPIGNVKVYRLQDMSEIPMCECQLGDADPCGPTSQCINRELHYECVASTCPNGTNCRNQRFFRRQYPAQKPFQTQDGRGWGLRALINIAKGEFVNEYIGDLIDEDEANRRLKYAHENNITDYYMMKLDNQRIIDAGPKGNLSRFANHSCDPNLNTEKWTVNGDVRVGLFAVKDIKTGDELTFNYNFMSLGQEMLNCKCGASNCVGFLGAGGSKPVENDEQTSQDSNESESSYASSDSKLVTGRKRRKVKSTSESSSSESDHCMSFRECYRCQKNFPEGSVVQKCSRLDCKRIYHLSCLELCKIITDNWTCPWHYCDICGRPSHVFCQKCPSSYCQVHADGSVCVLLEEDTLTFCKRALIICMSHDSSRGKENAPPVVLDGSSEQISVN